MKTSKAFTLTFCIILLFNLHCLQSAIAQNVNDHIFASALAAKTSISFDNRGFIIKGKRTFIVSAGLEYARIPHELWADRLLRLKRAGFNCIEIYTMWNFHEEHEGVFNFSGDHDLDVFLKLVKQLDLYAIVRVGPYYCAEWDLGGYPLWLHFKDNLLLRQPNIAFQKSVGLFFNKLLPIVSRNQINHGGSVILVQLENEHPSGWGTDMPNSYFKFLQTKALKLGIQVPYFFSGLHHGSDPAGNKPSLDDSKRPNPWLSTEFWSVWYNYYGSSQKDADIYGRRTWKIIAHGGNGYNYYMAHGGTNFAFSNSNEDAASYDYGAAVGQTGDLRPIYYQFKRNALFARGFEDILENSTDGGNAYNYLCADTAVHITNRKSKSGDIVFLDNSGSRTISLKLNIDQHELPDNGLLDLGPREIFPLVHDFQLVAGVKLNWALTRILGISKDRNTTTLVVYGDANANAQLVFTAETKTRFSENANQFKKENGQLHLRFQFDPLKPQAYAFTAGSQTIRVLAVKTELADRTWFIPVNTRNFIVTGPEYIGKASIAANQLKLNTEHFWGQANVYPVWVNADTSLEGLINKPAVHVIHTDSLPFSGKWLVKQQTAPAATSFDDSKWKRSEKPLQMGADGDLSPDAWYRAKITIDTAGLYTLRVKNGGDRQLVYIDNIVANSGSISKTELQLMLDKGIHTLAIFTAHDGRDKLYNYIGALKNKDVKGLADSVILQKGNTRINITGWRMKGGQGIYLTGNPFTPIDSRPNLAGPCYYKNSFQLHSSGDLSKSMWRISFEGLGHGSVYINEHNIGRYPEKIPVQSMYIPECWLHNGENNVVVFDEDGFSPVKIRIKAESIASKDLDILNFRLK